MGLLSFAEGKALPNIIAAELTSSSLLDGGTAGGATFTSNGANADLVTPVQYNSISAGDQTALEAGFYLQFELEVKAATDGTLTIADGVLIEGATSTFEIINNEFVWNVPGGVSVGDAIPMEITKNSKGGFLVITISFDGTDVIIWSSSAPVKLFEGISFSGFFATFAVCNDSGGTKSLATARNKNLLLIAGAQSFPDSDIATLEIGDSFSGRASQSDNISDPDVTGFSGNESVVSWKSITANDDGTITAGDNGSGNGGDYENGIGYAGGTPFDDPSATSQINRANANMDGGAQTEVVRALNNSDRYLNRNNRRFNYSQSGNVIGTDTFTGVTANFAKFEANALAVPVNVINFNAGQNDVSSERPTNPPGPGNSLSDLEQLLRDFDASPLVATNAIVTIPTLTTRNNDSATTDTDRTELARFNSDVKTTPDFAISEGLKIIVVVIDVHELMGGDDNFDPTDYIDDDFHLSPQGSSKQGVFIGAALIEALDMTFSTGNPGPNAPYTGNPTDAFSATRGRPCLQGKASTAVTGDVVTIYNTTVDLPGTARTVGFALYTGDGSGNPVTLIHEASSALITATGETIVPSSAVTHPLIGGVEYVPVMSRRTGSSLLVFREDSAAGSVSRDDTLGTNGIFNTTYTQSATDGFDIILSASGTSATPTEAPSFSTTLVDRINLDGDTVAGVNLVSGIFDAASVVITWDPAIPTGLTEVDGVVTGTVTTPTGTSIATVTATNAIGKTIRTFQWTTLTTGDPSTGINIPINS